MQLSNSLFLQTTFLVCIYFFLTFRSFTLATEGVGVRRSIVKSTDAESTGAPPAPPRRKGSSLGSSVHSRSNSQTSSITPTALRTKVLPFVLPSGADTSGYFSLSAIEQIKPYKAEAIHFYKSKSANLREQIVAYVEIWDLIAKFNPSYFEMLKTWQAKNKLTVIKPSGDHGIMAGALQIDQLSFLDVVLGAGLVQKLGIDYEHILPTHDTILSTPELSQAFRTLWKPTSASLTNQMIKSNGVTLNIDKFGFKISYSPMFDMDAVAQVLKDPNALVSSWKGVSVPQIEAFLKAIHEYEIMRLHEVIMSTLPNPASPPRRNAMNPFNTVIPGTKFNLQIIPSMVDQDGLRAVDINMYQPTAEKPYVEVTLNAERENLVEALDQLSVSRSPFYTFFQKMHQMLMSGPSPLKYDFIHSTIETLKRSQQLPPNTKALFKPFSVLDQYYTFKAATFSIVQDNFKPHRGAQLRIYGKREQGLQFEVSQTSKITLKYQNMLPPMAPQGAPMDRNLALVLQSLDFYKLTLYLHDFQRIASQYKEMEAYFSQEDGSKVQLRPKPPKAQSQYSEDDYSDGEQSFSNSLVAQRESPQVRDSEIQRFRANNRGAQRLSSQDDESEVQLRPKPSRAPPRHFQTDESKPQRFSSNRGEPPRRQFQTDESKPQRFSSNRGGPPRRQFQTDESKPQQLRPNRGVLQRQDAQDDESEVQLRPKPTVAPPRRFQTNESKPQRFSSNSRGAQRVSSYDDDSKVQLRPKYRVA